MDKENAASRLYRIFREVETTPGNTLMADVWAKIFFIPDTGNQDRYFLISEKIIAIGKEISELSTLLSKNMPAHIYQSGIDGLKAVASPFHLNVHLQSVIGNIPPGFINQMYMLSYISPIPCESKMSDEIMDGLIKSINDLKNFVISDDIDPDLRKVMYVYIQKIESAIINYRISGKDALIEVLDATYPMMVRNEKIIKENSVAHEKMFNVFEGVRKAVDFCSTSVETFKIGYDLYKEGIGFFGQPPIGN